MKKQEFLEKARNEHGYKYNYLNLSDKITLKDNIQVSLDDEIFTQNVSKHLSGRCPEKKINKMSNSDFISKSNIVWENSYDYSIVEYKGSLNPVKIKVDGFIYEQRASSHLIGISPDYRKHAEHSRILVEDNIGNKEIEDFLTKYNIDYIKDFRFGYLKFSFHIPKMRYVIDFKSRLHYDLENVIEYDNQKMLYCEDNYINYITIKYDQLNIIWEILWDNLKLFIVNNKAN